MEILEPKSAGLPDTAHANPRYGEEYGASQLATVLVVYVCSDPGAARVVIVMGLDFAGTSQKLFWPEVLAYLFPEAELIQILTLVVAMKSEMPCEPELLLFAGMNDHLHAAGLLEPLRNGKQTPKKIWEAVKTLFTAMNEIHELMAARLGSETKVVFTSSPAYSIMLPALRDCGRQLTGHADGCSESRAGAR